VSAARPIRASDQDRQEAVLALTDHFTEGRLDRDEFGTRMGAAQEATYLHDLDPLFEDLPVRRAGAGPASAPVPRRRGPARWGAFPRIPIFPLLVVGFVALVVASDGHALWLLLPLWFVAASAMRRRAWQHRVAVHRGHWGAPAVRDDGPRWR
jgi:hypothetical protein